MKLNPGHISIIKRLLSGYNNRPLLSILQKIELVDLASLFNHISQRDQYKLIEALIEIKKASKTLVELPESQLTEIIENMEESMQIQVISKSSEDDAAFLLSLIDEEKRQGILAVIEDKQKRSKIEQFLSYPKDSAGRLMHAQVFTLPSHITTRKAVEIMKEKRDEFFYYIYVVNKENRLEGVLSLRNLVTAQDTQILSDLLKKDIVTLSPKSSSEEVAKIVSLYDLIAIPVVSEDRRLLGLITIDSVVDILQEKATADIYARAGLQEGDQVYSTTAFKIKARLPWMALNLVLAALASSVVSLFEDTMKELIILASLKNIVAGMSGNTAIQTLTVVTRGLATGDFKFTSKLKSVLREGFAGLAIGVLTGIAAAILVWIWKDSFLVAQVIFYSMILNSLVASFAGAIIPLLLNRLKMDPAIGSGVVVTMITDIFSFFSFLGIAYLSLQIFV